MKQIFSFLLMVLCAAALPARADDFASVETEAQEIAERIRCLVCSEENIESATDETAKDLRLFIRRHLNDGKPQDLVVNLVLAQYGDMLSPEEAPQGSTDKNELLLTWLSALFSFGPMAFYIFRRSRQFKDKENNP